MDNSGMSRNRHNNDHLSVNKMGKNIRKSPVHQPSFSDAARQQPQPQVYNINKNDFRNFVQQLTGSPSRETPPRPRQNSPKPSSMRLQKIRPPPLTPVNRPQLPIRQPALPPAAAAVPYNNNLVRAPVQFGQPSPTMPPPGDSFWANRAESPISAYMRYLQTSFIDSGPVQDQAQSHAQHLPQLQPQVPGQIQAQPPSTGLLLNPPVLPFPSPRMNGPPSPFLSSPQMNAPPFLPSPTIFPSPTGFPNLLSPWSPYALLSPGNHPPPLTPNFAFSPMAQSGILGPGPQPPRSPGVGFPLSPSGIFPSLSPRWRDQ